MQSHCVKSSKRYPITYQQEINNLKKNSIETIAHVCSISGDVLTVSSEPVCLLYTQHIPVPD